MCRKKYEMYRQIRKGDYPKVVSVSGPMCVVKTSRKDFIYVPIHNFEESLQSNGIFQENLEKLRGQLIKLARSRKGVYIWRQGGHTWVTNYVKEYIDCPSINDDMGMKEVIEILGKMQYSVEGVIWERDLN